MRRGAADQDVEPAERVVRRLGDRTHLRLVGDIASAGDGLGAGRTGQFSGRFSTLNIDIDASDRGAGLGECNRDCPADAAAGAADQSCLAGKAHRANSLGGHSITVPPSMAMVWPVIKALSADKSHAIVPAKSAGTRFRWVVCCAFTAFTARSSLSPKNSLVSSVKT